MRLVHLGQRIWSKRRMRRQTLSQLTPGVRRNGGDVNRIVSQVLDYLIFTVLLLSGAAFLMALMRLL
jgi:hypothetical protein